MEAGQLKNLNDCVEGSVITHVNGKVGIQQDAPWTKVTVGETTNVCEARLCINYGKGKGESYMTYRIDGRSHCDPEYDIVSIELPEA